MIIHPPQLTLLKIDLVSVWHLKERSQVLETCNQLEIPFNAEVTICISIPRQLRINVSHTVVTKISFGKGILPNNILTKDFS